MEDVQIVDLYFARSEQAIEETANRYGSYLLTIARNILISRSDAEEAVNDTYLGAWRSIPPHRPQRLSTYLGKITRRVSLGRWKAANAQKRGGGEVSLALEELGECLPGGDSPERAMEQKELTQLLGAFIRNLPETEQRVFVCRYWYLSPVKTIARDYGFSESKVKSMLSRTRGKLKACLEKEGIFV